MASLAVVLVAAAIGVGVWTLGHHHTTPHPGTTPSHHSTHTTPTAAALTPVSAAAFGPNGGDNASEAPLAIDGRPGTDWTTDSYLRSPHFGNLYGGTGLLLDMGRRVSVSSVTVTFGPVPGAHVRIEVGNSNSGSSPAGFTPLAHSNNVSGTYTFTGHSAVTGQFVLIWFTKLPPQSGTPGHFQAAVFNVTVRGSP
jgi:hypothetical protein